jgi:response regulator RpfG family c-di-GMP phosphodiesterase
LTNATISVLVFAAATTLWLIYYVRFYLPNQLEQRFLESMKAFSKAIELRFPLNAGGSDEVIHFATLMGKQFGYSRTELHELSLAAHLRDIGCCAIPYRPFSEKSRSDWTASEARVFERHPEVSGAMLELVPSLRHVADMVRWHHARFDGSNVVGSPVGSDLPLSARILKVASDFVHLSHEIGSGAAAKVIESGKGTEYCPDVVEEFVQVLRSSRVKEPEPSLAGF